MHGGGASKTPFFHGTPKEMGATSTENGITQIEPESELQSEKTLPTTQTACP